MIITYASHKGGCGKTTGAANHAAYLQSRGAKVAIIDTDPNKHLKEWSERRTASGVGAPIETVWAVGEIHRIIMSLAADHDAVVIDSAGVQSDAGAIAVGLADVAIYPFIPSWMDIETARAVDLQVFQIRAKANPNLKAFAYLSSVTTNSFSDERLEASEALTSLFDTVTMLRGATKTRKAYRDSFARGLGVVDWTDNKAKAEVQLLMQEIHREE